MEKQLKLFDTEDITTVYDHNGLAGQVVEIKDKHISIMWKYGQYTFLLNGLKEIDGKYYI